MTQKIPNLPSISKTKSSIQIPHLPDLLPVIPKANLSNPVPIHDDLPINDHSGAPRNRSSPLSRPDHKSDQHARQPSRRHVGLHAELLPAVAQQRHQDAAEHAAHARLAMPRDPAGRRRAV